MLNLLFHFKSDTSEESLGNCLFRYVVSLNNVKVDVSLSVSLSLFQLKRETAEEAPGSLRTGSEEASVAAYKIPPSPLCNHSVTGMCMIFTFSLCLTPVRLSWTPLQSLYIWVLFQKLVRCLQSQHRKAFSWLFYIKGNLIMTPSVPLDSKTYQWPAMSFQLSKKYSKKVNKRNIYNTQTWISFSIFIDHIL